MTSWWSPPAGPGKLRTGQWKLPSRPRLESSYGGVECSRGHGGERIFTTAPEDSRSESTGLRRNRRTAGAQRTGDEILLGLVGAVDRKSRKSAGGGGRAHR